MIKQIKIIIMAIMLFIMNVVSAKALIISKTAGADNSKLGETLTQSFEIKQSDPLDITEIRSLDVQAAPGLLVNLVQDLKQPCLQQPNTLLDADNVPTCHFELQLTPTIPGEVSYAIHVEGNELSAFGDALSIGNFSGKLLVNETVGPKFMLSFDDVNPVSTPVGVTKLLTFHLSNDSDSDVTLNNLLDTLDSSIFTLMPDSDCMYQILNRHNKTCRFILSYSPTEAEEKTVHLSLHGTDSNGSLLTSNLVELHLQATQQEGNNLTLSYNGEVYQDNEGKNVEPMQSFTVTYTGVNPITIRPLSLSSVDNTCTTPLSADTARTCNFKIPNENIATDEFTLIVSADYNEGSSKQLNSNSVTVPINHVDIKLASVEPYTDSTRKYTVFLFRVTNPSNKEVKYKVTGHDLHSNIVLGTTNNIGNVYIMDRLGDNEKYGWCPTAFAGLNPKAEFRVPANTSCEQTIIADCSLKKDKVNSGANVFDGCIDPKTEQPFTSSEFEIKWTQLETGLEIKALTIERKH